MMGQIFTSQISGSRNFIHMEIMPMHNVKKRAIHTVAATALLAISAQTPAETSFNFGFGLGPGQVEVDKNNFNDGSLGNTVETDSNTLAWNIYGEVKFNPYLRLEFGAIDSGMASMDATSNGTGYYWWSGPVSADYGLFGIKVGAMGVLPLDANEKFKLMGKVGLINWFSSVTLSDYYSDETEVDTGISPYYGVGAELDLTQRMSLRVQYEAFSASADSDYLVDGYEFDYSGTTVGLLFRF